MTPFSREGKAMSTNSVVGVWTHAAMRCVVGWLIISAWGSAQIASAAVADGSWQTLDNVSVVQGSRFYARGIGYYTDNTTTATGDVTATGLRLVVTSSSHDVTNADGVDDMGHPFFTLASLNDTTRIYFAIKRAAFSYTAEVQGLVAPPATDSDGDGIPDETDTCPLDPLNDVDGDGICGDVDLCPNDAANACVTLSGQVFGNGATLSAASVKVGTNTVSTVTDAAGYFTANVGGGELSSDNVDRFFPVEVKVPGFATGNVKVPFVQGKLQYDVVVNLRQVSDTVETTDDLNAGVDVIHAGQTVGSLMIPDTSLPSGVTEVSGSITYLNPLTDEILAAPGGDLLALPAGADPNATPVQLETFGMMEFDLRDQSGNPITTLSGPAEVCMAATPGLAAGDTVPLWYYDEGAGLWKEEGQGTVVDRGGRLQICGDVTHFTWWNYDQPIETHSCFHFRFVDEATGQTVSGLDWRAEGVTYSGTSPGRACSDGGSSFDSLTVKISASTSSREQIKVFAYVGGGKYYIVRDGDGTYSLTSNPAAATVFDTPLANGSCLSGTESGTCQPLDFLDTAPDGVLPLDVDIDLPPVISNFTVADTSLLVSQSTMATATVTDPEGQDVSIAWSSTCNYDYGGTGGGSSVAPMTDAGPSGNTFSTQFTAPASLSWPYEYCEITLQATDAAGAVATATRWVVVSGNFSYSFSGVLYGTDGAPLPGALISHVNDCDGSISQAVSGPAGEYSVTVDLSACSINGQNYYYYLSLGRLLVDYQHDGVAWQKQIELDYLGYYGFGVCTVGTNGLTSCDLDVRLPTVWAPISGDVYLAGTGSAFWSYQSTTSAYYGEFGGFDGDSASIVSGLTGPVDAQPYGPVQVPVGFGLVSGFVETSPGSGGFGLTESREVFVPSTDGVIVDLADSAAVTAPVTVTVFDNAGAPLAGQSATANANLLSSGGVQIAGQTDAAGQIAGALPLSTVYAFSSGTVYAYGGGYANVKDAPLLIDLNGPESCRIIGTYFDVNGQPLANTNFTVEGYSTQSVTLNVMTDASGQFAFDMRPGEFTFYDLAAYYYSYQYLDNCRPQSGSQREVRRDFVRGATAFGGFIGEAAL